MKQSKLASVHTKSEFRQCLVHERARVDRAANKFALVVFGQNACRSDPSLARRAVKRLRVTDRVGWLDQSKLGILLPATSIASADTLATDILNGTKARLPDQPYAIYTYPRHDREAEQESGSRGFSPVDDEIAPVLRPAIPIWKRTLDIFGALFALLLFSPVFALLPLFIKVVSPGPMIFRQERVGRGGKLFWFLKFRTMKPSNDISSHQQHVKQLIRQNGALVKLDDKGDPRIIPGGRIIRKLCLDELPQLINVLRGEMSLVGPRPCFPYEADEYLTWHAHRFDSLPGMTGLWQVSGKNRTTFAEMIRMDIQYTTNVTLGNDLKILLLTWPSIVALAWESVTARITGSRGSESGSSLPERSKAADAT